MPTIRLRAREMITEQGREVISDRYAVKVIDWPVVPRQGEDMWLEGNAYEVAEVSHLIDKPGQNINIIFDCNHQEFERFLDEGWRID